MSYEELLEGRRALRAWKTDRRLKSFYPRPIPNYTDISDVERTLIHETEGLLLDFTDEYYKSTTGLSGLALVKDRTVLDNNFNGSPFELVTYSGASKKIIRGPNGLLYENDPEVDLPYEWDEDGNLLGIRIEEQRTNLVLASHDMSVEWYVYDLNWATGNSNQAEAPDGTITATLYEIHSLNPAHFIDLYTAVGGIEPNTDYTVSMWVKVPTGTKRFQLDWYRDSGAEHETKYFTATTEWQRFSFTYKTGSSDNTRTLFLSIIGEGEDGDRTGSEMYMWGTQVEQGISLTSTIITTGSTVTRAEDVISLTDAFPIGVEGTFYAKVRWDDTPFNSPMGIRLDDGSDNGANPSNKVQLDRFTSGIGARVKESIGPSSFDNSFPGGEPSVDIFTKCIMLYAVNDHAWTRDGLTPSTDTAVGSPGANLTRLFLKTTSPFHLAELIVLPRRMSNEEGQAFTA